MRVVLTDKALFLELTGDDPRSMIDEARQMLLLNGGYEVTDHKNGLRVRWPYGDIGDTWADVSLRLKARGMRISTVVYGSELSKVPPPRKPWTPF